MIKFKGIPLKPSTVVGNIESNVTPAPAPAAIPKPVAYDGAMASTVTLPKPVAAPASANTPVPTPEPAKKDPKAGAEYVSVASVIAAAQKSKGSHVAVTAVNLKPIERTPTGIFELDFYLGGGFMNGRINMVYGPEQSCKTNICYATVAQAQRRPGPCNKAVWFNLEQSFDPAYAALWGVDINELIVVSPAYGEEAVDLIEAFIRADDVAIVVVDSLACIVAAKEVNQSTETADVGTASLLTKRCINKIIVAFGAEAKKGHFPCVMAIQQIRYKIGVTHGNPEVIPGGQAQLFHSSLRIRVSAKKEKAKDGDPNVYNLNTVHAIVKKSRGPVLSTDFSFDLVTTEYGKFSVGDTDSFGMVMKYLKQLDLVENITTGPKEGKGWRVLGVLFKTQTEMADCYLDDEDFRMALQKTVIDAFKGQGKTVDEPTAPIEQPPAGMMTFKQVNAAPATPDPDTGIATQMLSSDKSI